MLNPSCSTTFGLDPPKVGEAVGFFRFVRLIKPVCFGKFSAFTCSESFNPTVSLDSSGRFCEPRFSWIRVHLFQSFCIVGFLWKLMRQSIPLMYQHRFNPSVSLDSSGSHQFPYTFNRSWKFQSYQKVRLKPDNQRKSPTFFLGFNTKRCDWSLASKYLWALGLKSFNTKRCDWSRRH